MPPTEYSPTVRLEICNGRSALASRTALHAPRETFLIRSRSTIEKGTPSPAVRPVPALPRSVHGLRMIRQADRRKSGSDVEPGISLDAERLQHNGAVRAADERIDADADPDRSAGGASDIIAGQRAWGHARLRREYGPHDHAILGVTDIGAEFRDLARILFGNPVHAGHRAIKRTRRPENETPAARHVAA